MNGKPIPLSFEGFRNLLHRVVREWLDQAIQDNPMGAFRPIKEYLSK